MSRILTKFIIMAGLLPVAPAFAQDAPAAADDRQSDDIIVVATGVEQAADTSGQAVTVIDRATIEQRQTVAVADLLATTPGVTMSRNGGIGTVTGISIRGAETTQTLTIIDGVRVNDPSSPGGAFDFGTLLAGSVDRIEVLRGPNSVPWGSEAIGGVVNITTAQPTEGLQGRGNIEYGSFNTVVANAGISGSSGIFSGALTGGYMRSDGISAAANGTEPDGFRQYGATGKLGVEFAPGFGLDLRGYYAQSRTDLDGFPPPDYVLADDPEYSTSQEIYGYAGLHANLLDDRFKNRVAFTLTDINRDNFDPTDGTAPTFIGRGRSYRYEYQGDFKVIDQIRLVAGAEHEDSTYYDGTTFASNGTTSFYGEAIVNPIRQLTLTGGIRHDDNDMFGGHTTLGADAALALDTGTTLRASYGEGFMAPTLYQLFGDYGTRSLQPATSRNYDLGVEQSFLDRRATVGVTYFHRDTKNQIDFIECPTGVSDPNSICFNRPYGTYANIDVTRAQGVEFELTLRPIDALTVTGNFSYIDARNLSPGVDYGNDLALRPQTTTSVSVDYRLPFGLSLGATVRQVGASYDDVANLIRIQGYVVTDIRAEMPVAKNFSVYCRIENLFNEQYQTITGYGTYGRAAYGGVRVKFD
jgi:vitamin B12 transporter